MDTAEKIGLLPGFGWIAGHNTWVTLAFCLLLTPVGHCLVGLIGESRWVPLSPSKQFLSFFPGDLFLGVMAASLLVSAQDLPGEKAWYNATWWHVLVLVGALVIATVLTWLEWKSGVYPTAAVFSPTKIYHNFLLYGGYGYIIVTTLVAVLAAELSWAFIMAALVPGLAWVWLVVQDNSLSGEAAKRKASYAHVADWSPIWHH